MKYDKTIRSPVLLGGLAAKFVAMSEAEAVQVARAHFGIEGHATRFAAEKNDTFRIASTGGPRFILKVANPAEDVLEIDLQLRVLEHLAAATPEIPVPRVIANGLGKVLARLRLALADFGHAADSRVIAWDVKHLLSLESLLGEIAEPAKRKQLEDGLARFGRIEGRLAKSRVQVLHNDFSRSNIVVDPSSSTFISGVIDFGDTVRTSIAIDVSTAVLSLLPREAGGHDMLADGRDLLNGYLTVADLTEEELRLIPHLVMGRVVAKTLLSTWLANSVPENAAYFLRNTEQGQHQLEWFLKRSEAEVSDQFLNLVV